jgi:electron transfer flavoprotein alpha subunit
VSKVLAVLEQRDGALRKVSFEVVTAARRLGASVDAVVCSASGPEGCATAVAERAKSGGYDVLVFAATATGKDLAPRVAAKLGVGVATDVTDLTSDGGTIVATRPVYAGKALQKVKVLGKPAIVSVRPNVFTPDAQAAQVKPETLSVASPGRVVIREIKAAPAGMLDVAEAQVIISGGRGLKEPANFKVLEELAGAFGGRAAVGASRAVVDAGWRAQDGQPVALHRHRHFGSDSAPRGHADVEGHRRDQQGQGRADLQSRRLRRRRRSVRDRAEAHRRDPEAAWLRSSFRRHINPRSR